MELIKILYPLEVLKHSTFKREHRLSIDCDSFLSMQKQNMDWDTFISKVNRNENNELSMFNCNDKDKH